MLNRKINISIYSLALLPVDYLDRLGDPFETACAGKHIEPGCRPVFTSGIRAYQLATYLRLVREHYGRGVANQIGSYQRRLLQPEDDSMDKDAIAVELVRGALESERVTADAYHGSVEIPIEMNIALALLLGMPESPYYTSDAGHRIEKVSSMGKDLDWSLSQCLVKAREEIERIFSPLLACIDSGVPVDHVEAWLSDRQQGGKINYQ
ncbi:MAG: hypothetical protein OEU78_05935 [Gammaproteobacteria bacterium]|jgi:hypothetical protein|nr:hypothetical protein [Gammaproteobacteria bacterium]MDH3888018.1 hypothetical protein [Gammaproteobacteria bacterium]